jgi:hypothetical protein
MKSKAFFKTALTVSVLTALCFLLPRPLPAASEPDLVITDIRLVRGCKILVTIKNIGTVGVPDSFYNLPNAVGVQMYNGSQAWGGIILKGFDPQGNLKSPGGSVSHLWFPSTANLNLTPGIHSIKVIVDHSNVLTEANEYNNRLTRRLRCVSRSGNAPVVGPIKPAGPASAVRPLRVIRTPKSFSLQLTGAYLIITKSTRSIQVAAEGAVLSYGDDWLKCRVTPTLFHIKQKFWKNFFWAVDTTHNVVFKVESGSFCKEGGYSIRLPGITVSSTAAQVRLNFSRASLNYLTDSRALQVQAERAVLSYGTDFEKCNLNPYTFQIKQKFWRNFYWSVNTSTGKVHKNTGTFCKNNPPGSQLNIKVRVY